MRLRILSVGLPVLLATTIASADTISLHPARDNTLYDSASGDESNGAGNSIFVGLNSRSDLRRAVLAFDIAGALPEEATIESAELHLTVLNAPTLDPVPLDVHRLLADWGEGGSVAGGGGGVAPDTLDATWLHTFYPKSFWDTPGGDFDPVAHASGMTVGAGTFVWADSALAVDVQSWLDDPASNFGWLLLGDEVTPSTSRRIHSRESFDPDSWPSLVLQYRTEPSSIDETTWGHAKSLYFESTKGSVRPSGARPVLALLHRVFPAPPHCQR